jgi:hypothetical protein
LIRSEILLDGGSIHLDAHLFIDRDGYAHAAQQLDHGGYILKMRHVRYRHGAIRQQTTRQDRQGGILRAGNAHLTLERNAALNL